MKLVFFFLSIVFIFIFTFFSYTVGKERWQQIDFDTTVKLQDRIPRKFDEKFSFLSLLGSAEVTVSFCFLMVLLSILRREWLGILGWLMILPASAGEVFGKLILFHPAPPVFFHRTILSSGLPQFYIHTNFSYPSGHMTRTIFIATILVCLVLFSKFNNVIKVILITPLLGFSFMMGLTRVYLGEHWLSDVLGGSLLGAAMGLFGLVLILSKKRGIRETAL